MREVGFKGRGGVSLLIFGVSASLSVGLSTESYAQEFAPALGKGVNISETRTYSTCIRWDKSERTSIESETNNPSLTRLYNEVWIRSRQQLNTELGIDASIIAKGLWGGGYGVGGGGATYFSKVEITTDNFYWMVDAHYQKSRKMLNTGHHRFDLTDRAKKILADHGIKAFYDACGTHFYSGQNVGSRYTLLYEFKSKQDKVIDRLKAAAAFGHFGINGKSDFQNYMDMATQSSMLKVHSHIQGGDHNLKDFASDPEALKDELRKLRHQVYDDDKGVVLSWFIDDYGMFPEVIAAKAHLTTKDEFTDRFRNDVLSQLFNLYDYNQTGIASLKNSISQSEGEERLFLYSSEKLQTMRAEIADYERQNELIRARAMVCLAGEDSTLCHAQDLHPMGLSLPSPDKDLTGIDPWYLYAVVPNKYWRSYELTLLADHPETSDLLKFESYGKLFASNDTLFVRVQTEDGKADQIAVGIPRMIQDPLPRLGLCAGIYKEVCTLRILENPYQHMKDGSPLRKLQLVIYTKLGFVLHKFDFPVSL